MYCSQSQLCLLSAERNDQSEVFKFTATQYSSKPWSFIQITHLLCFYVLVNPFFITNKVETQCK